MPKLIIFSVLFFLCGVGMESNAQDRDNRKIIQLSGIILSEDSISAIPGAHIYVPKSGRGTISSSAGYFSFPTMEGDSVVISSIGYERQYYIVPRVAGKQFVTIVVKMPPSVTELDEINITLFPTEEVFKGAVLALNIPTDRGIAMDVLNMEEFVMMMRTAPMDDYANYQYYTSQYSGYIDDQFRPRTNPFLDIFNWYYFFRNLKKKKKK